jgi:hypothetical protein
MLSLQPDLPAVIRVTLRQRGRIILPAVGTSMGDAVPPGSRIEVRTTCWDEIRAGDLLLFEVGGELFCHRLLRKHRRVCTLKGDALAFCDPPVPFEHVLGRVTHIVLESGTLVSLDEPAARLAAHRAASGEYLRLCLRRRLRRFWGGGT